MSHLLQRLVFQRRISIENSWKIHWWHRIEGTDAVFRRSSVTVSAKYPKNTRNIIDNWILCAIYWSLNRRRVSKQISKRMFLFFWLIKRFGFWSRIRCDIQRAYPMKKEISISYLKTRFVGLWSQSITIAVDFEPNESRNHSLDKWIFKTQLTIHSLCGLLCVRRQQFEELANNGRIPSWSPSTSDDTHYLWA